MNKVIFITGASRGIGHELTKCFLKEGNVVIGTSRSGVLPDLPKENLHALPLDLSSYTSIKKVAQYIGKENMQIDMVINNAGIGPDLSTMKPDIETFTKTFAVNVHGTTFLTESLIPLMKNGGKIVNITSKMGSIHDCISSDSVAYRMSKTALNMYTRILTNRHKDNLKIAAIHPGWVKTSISENSAKHGRLMPADSAQRIFDFISRDYRSGIFWDVEAHEELEW